jgi:lipid-A-disaccharide synthase
MSRTIYLVAGEASGDARGAELMKSLLGRDPDLKFFGKGGPLMRHIADREQLNDWIEEAGVIGFVDVLKKYPYFKREFDRTVDGILNLRPDAVVLIDYPGFNQRLAAALKQRDRSIRVIYYISPQAWAWHRSRIPRMARTIDLMLCIFPFEKAMYEDSGLRTEFVGHPMVDALGSKRVISGRDENLIGLFPGSRSKEVSKIFPIMLGAAECMHVSRPELRFEVAAASEKLADLIRAPIERAGAQSFCRVVVRQHVDLMQRASCGMVASGTATLEAAVLGMPYCLVYRVAWLTALVARRVIQVKYLGIVNILADCEVVKEFLQENATPEAISEEMLRLVNDPEARERLSGSLSAVVARLGGGGASERAAEAIISEMDRRV